jgi:hypothetical protein
MMMIGIKARQAYPVNGYRSMMRNVRQVAETIDLDSAGLPIPLMKRLINKCE